MFAFFLGFQLYYHSNARVHMNGTAFTAVKSNTLLSVNISKRPLFIQNYEYAFIYFEDERVESNTFVQPHPFESLIRIRQLFLKVFLC